MFYLPPERTCPTGLSPRTFGKRASGVGSAGSCGPRYGDLIRNVLLDGRRVRALIDTGCSVTLIDKNVVGNRSVSNESIELETMERRALRTRGVVRLLSLTCDGVELGPVNAHIVSMLPLNVDLVIGLDVIARVGISVRANGYGVGVFFDRGRVACAGNAKALRVEDTDFSTWFDDNHWTVKWAWKDDRRANESHIEGYDGHVPEHCRDAFDAEIQQWVEEGILIPHDRLRHGPVQRFLPMLAVQQDKGGKKKVRPVMDYRFLNQDIESHPGGATPVCAERLRQWRQLGSKCAVLDLRKAYLQVFVEPSL